MSNFKNTKPFYNYSTTDIVAENLRERYIHGLIKAGAYTSFTDKQLDLSKDTSYRVYEGYGARWTWEVAKASGITVNDSIAPSYTVDYLNGRIIFDSPLSFSDKVKANYTFDDIGVYLANDPNWPRFIDSYVQGTISKERTLWVPSIVIDVGVTEGFRGLQLGGGEIQTFAVDNHFFAKNPFVLNRLQDLINDQIQTTFPLYNINTAPKIYGHQGELTGNEQTYDELIESNTYTNCYISESKIQNQGNNQGMYRGLVRTTLEVYRPPGTY